MGCCSDCDNGSSFCPEKLLKLHGGHLIMFVGVYVGASMLKVREPFKVAGVATSIDFVRHHFIDGHPLF